MSDIKPWKTLGSETVLESERLKVRKDTCLLPDGTILADYYVRETPDAALVFCLTKGDEVVLVRQFRQGAGTVTLELPGGFVSRHDRSAEDAARRELLEETGYTSDAFEQRASWLSSPATSTGRIAVFLARDADRVAAPKHQPGEFTEVVLVRRGELLSMLERGEIVSVSHVAAIHHVLDRLAAAAP